jgi:hypothetical protein
VGILSLSLSYGLLVACKMLPMKSEQKSDEKVEEKRVEVVEAPVKVRPGLVSSASRASRRLLLLARLRMSLDNLHTNQL